VRGDVQSSIKLPVRRLWHPKGGKEGRLYLRTLYIFPRVSVIGLSWLAVIFKFSWHPWAQNWIKATNKARHSLVNRDNMGRRWNLL